MQDCIALDLKLVAGLLPTKSGRLTFTHFSISLKGFLWIYKSEIAVPAVICVNG